LLLVARLVEGIAEFDISFDNFAEIGHEELLEGFD
jgi:hypothetical protein